MAVAREELFDIIRNGSKFLTALEEFADEYFPRGRNTMASGLNMNNADIRSEELFQIIHNGRKFLMALEVYAYANFPRVGDTINKNLGSTSSATSTMEFVLATTIPPIPAYNINTVSIVAAPSNSGGTSTDIPGVFTTTQDNTDFSPSATLAPSFTDRADDKNSAPTGPLDCSVDTAADSAYLPTGSSGSSSNSLGSTSATHAVSAPRLEDCTPPQEITTNISNLHRPVIQYCAETGKEVVEHKNKSEAAKAIAATIPGATVSNIQGGMCRVLHGQSDVPRYRSFYFQYDNNVITRTPQQFPIRKEVDYSEWKKYHEFNVCSKNGRMIVKYPNTNTHIILSPFFADNTKMVSIIIGIF